MTRLLIVLVVIAGCGKSNEDKIREQAERDSKRAPTVEPAEVKKMTIKQDPPPTAKQEESTDPEPTTPEEIDTARKKAMNAGRDKDVIKYCEQGNIDPAKTDAQVIMGCTLSACRLKDAEKAKQWAPGMLRDKKDKPLFEAAKKTCLGLGVAI